LLKILTTIAVFVVLIAAAIFLGACSDAPSARRALQQQGYTNITTTGYALFGCGKDDSYSTGFEATTPAGYRVSGVVCSSWSKGSTIRVF
jgi:hypothetical protein